MSQIPSPPNEKQTTLTPGQGGAASQHTLRNISLIIGREYTTRVRQRSFVISTIIMLIIVALGTCVPTIIAFFNQGSNDQKTLTVANNAGSIAGMENTTLQKTLSDLLNGDASHYKLKLEQGNSQQLEQQVKAGKLSVLVVIDRGADQKLHFKYYTSNTDSIDPDQSAVQAMAQQIAILDRANQLHLTPQQTQDLFAPVTLDVVKTQQDARSGTDLAIGMITAFIGVILIFVTVFMYGIQVANGVAEEKGNRIIEILVNATTPFQLMVGKVIGIGAVGLTQMAALTVTGILFLLLQHPLQNALGIGQTGITIALAGVSIPLLLLVFVFFILGFLLYATLFAAVGALVSRQEEVSSAATPLTWLFMIGYIVSLYGATTASAIWFKILSFIPFFTPTVMLVRVGTMSAAPWEIGLSILLMIAGIFVCAWVAARIYRLGILMYGQRPNMKEIIRMIRSK